MRRLKHISCYVIAAAVLTALSAGCMREEMSSPEIQRQRPEVPLNLDVISLATATGRVVTDADKLEYDVTVRRSNALPTKSGLDSDSVTVASVELTTYERGKNPIMQGVGQTATKSLYDQVTTRDLNSNFLRLDETVGTNDLATYEWETWDNAYMLEASVIATPDNTDNLYYRTVTFNPTQAYNIRTFNVVEKDGVWTPMDTIFYHSRMVSWYPMICTVPVGIDGDKAVIQLKDNRYVQYRKEISPTSIGIVFEHVLDGKTDLMMSNMCEAQRYHKNYGNGRDDAEEEVTPTTYTPHYRDLGKTLPESQEHYYFPFGHNEKNPTYSNPMFYHHYLSAIRIWAKVDQTGDAAALNLLTWGQINAVSVVNQPSSVIIALPDRVSSAVGMDEYGNIATQDGKIVFNQNDLVFGNVNEWGDLTNLPLCAELMFGEGDINHPDDREAHYPIDMTQTSDVHGMDAVYLGYCLVKPCAPFAEGEEDECITLAIQTKGGTYQAVIPCRAIIEDMETHSTEEVHVFEESKVYDITLNLKTAGTFSDFIAEEDTDIYEDLSPYDETNGTFKTANSYIVVADSVAARFTRGEHAPGYTFVGDIIGNGDAGIITTHGAQTFHTASSILMDATKAVVLWQSNRGQIYNVQYQHGYVRFLMGSSTPGNAVIAVTDDAGIVKWSWHIWITDNKPSHVNVGGVEYLDRNLGALWHYSGSFPSTDADRLKSYGLYYQWGRKDPMPTPASWNQNESTDIAPIYDEYGMEVTDMGAYVFDQCQTIEGAIEHPMHFVLCPFNQFYMHDWMATSLDFLWGEADGLGITGKSIYDPCPFGYRIVHNELQELLESSSTTVVDSENNGLRVTNGGTIYLPYAGYFGPDRNYTSNTNSGYFMGKKGDYTCGEICPNTDADQNNYFAGHRLRSYISHATSWTSENIDGVASFTYSANNGKHFVTSGITSKRDYTNRKTAGSVRCVTDGSYVRMAFAHLDPITRTLEAGNKVRLDINAGVNLGGIKNAWLKASYTDGLGTHDDIIHFVTNGVYQTAEFLSPFNGTYDNLKIEGTYDYTLPDPLPSNEYTYTFHVEENSGDVKEDSCKVRAIDISTVSITTTMASALTDGVHPYVGQNFSVTVTLKAGYGESITVNRNNFRAVNTNTFTAASASATTPDSEGYSTVTVTFNNVHFDEAGLAKTLSLTGVVTIDGVNYNWSDSFTTEVWEKVGTDGVDTGHPFTTLAAVAAYSGPVVIRNRSSSRYLYNNSGTPDVTGTVNYNNNYYWSISSTGSIRNMGNSRYIYVTSGNGIGLTNTLTNMTITPNDNYFFINNNGGNRRMRDNDGNLTTSNNGTNNDRQWAFYPVTEAKYVDPHIDAGSLTASGSGLHDGHPVVGQAFNAGYSVTVHDADAVSVNSAKIGGVTTTATVTASGDDFIVTLNPVNLTLNDWKVTEVPVEINYRITSASLGLSNASVTQKYAPTIAVWQRVHTGRSSGTQITTIAGLTAEDHVLITNRNYGTTYFASNGSNLTGKTTLSASDDSVLWRVSANGGDYNLTNIANGNKLCLGLNVCDFSSGNYRSSTNLTISLSSSYFRVYYDGISNYYLQQSGNTSYTSYNAALSSPGSNCDWIFYKVTETYSYQAPTE